MKNPFTRTKLEAKAKRDMNEEDSMEGYVCEGAAVKQMGFAFKTIYLFCFFAVSLSIFLKDRSPFNPSLAVYSNPPPDTFSRTLWIERNHTHSYADINVVCCCPSQNAVLGFGGRLSRI